MKTAQSAITSIGEAQLTVNVMKCPEGMWVLESVFGTYDHVLLKIYSLLSIQYPLKSMISGAHLIIASKLLVNLSSNDGGSLTW